jgi:very-short-patch-repair endonuclease
LDEKSKAIEGSTQIHGTLSKKLKDLKNKLTDLSKKNRSIMLRRCYKKSHYDLSALSEVEAGLAEKVLMQLLHQNAVSFLNLDSIKDKEVEQKDLLETLWSESDFLEKETGSYDIALGWPFVEGRFRDEIHTEFRCPLFLIPVRLEPDFSKNHFKIIIDKKRQPSLNKAFLLATQKFNELKLLPEMLEDLDELPWQNKEHSAHDIVEQIIKLYSDNGIDMEESTSLDKIEKFVKLSEQPDSEVSSFCKVLPYAIIGQFPQAATSLLADYDNLIKIRPTEGKMVEMLSDKSNVHIEETRQNRNISETDNYFIRDTDLSQEQILIESRNKNDLVVRGPPGTGKSQVIANLVADRVARGKHVLVVCEKRPALDVVYRRLQDAGLDSMLALVHNPEADRNVLYEKIRQILDANKTNSEVSYEELQHVSENIDTLQETLTEYSDALYKKQECGLSLFELYIKDKRDIQETLDLTKFADEYSDSDLKTLIQEARKILPLMKKYDGSDNILKYRENFADKTAEEISKTINAIENLTSLTPNAVKLPELAAVKNLMKESDMTGLDYLNKQIMLIRKFSKEGALKWLNPLWYLKKGSYERSIKRLLNTNKESSSDAPAEFIEFLQGDRVAQSKLKTVNDWKEMEYIINEFNRLINEFGTLKGSLQDNLIKDWKSRLLNFDMSPITELKSLPISRKVYDEIQKLDLLLGEKSEKDQRLIRLAFESNEKMRIDETLSILEVSFVRSWIDLGERETPILRKLSQEDYEDKRTDLDGLIKEKMNKVPKEIKESWASNIKYLPLFCLDDALKGDEKEIIDWLKDDQLSQGWLDWENTHISKHPEDQEIILGDGSDKTVSLMLLGDIQTKDDVTLNLSFTVPVHRRESEHDRSYEYAIICRIKRIDGKIYLCAERQQGTLLHEVMKKRRRLTLRNFVERYTHKGLFELLPCWLCSPETVSAILPLERGFFDLVVFDESSQCPLEKAIPAIYRGESVLVAGDEKQLPPFDLFRIYYSEDEEDEDSELIQSESLLHAAAALYPQRQLLWHYRSDYDALIRFSNAAFYDNTLHTISYNESNITPFRWIKVNGVWERRQNRAEAEKIVAIVKEIIAKPHHPSIGIVTFNSEQKELIKEFLDAEAAKDRLFGNNYTAELDRKDGEESHALFVKNIETVQGDERDIILFSIAYAPDARGKIELKFGSLSTSGGENRLNVAISRAKKQVIIVTSLDPERLPAERTANEGPKMLKSYLTYVRAVAEGKQKTADAIIDALAKPTLVTDLYANEFEEDIADSLRSRGYEVEMHVGCSNYYISLAVADKKKGNYALGIECDGTSYRLSPNVRDRDIYRRRFLKSRGWKVAHISSRAWWLDKEEVLDKIEAKIKSSE